MRTALAGRQGSRWLESIAIGPNEAVLARARARQKDPEWVVDYWAIRPKVERK
ncbi:MAG: hypothetical protein ACYCS7_04945 [Acidimicrobiales bacterium]